MVQAQRMGVTEEWVRKVAVANPTRHQLFLVRKIDCGPSNGRSLQAQDIILTLNDQLITRVSNFDITFDKESLNALVVRQGKELRLTPNQTTSITALRQPTSAEAPMETPQAPIPMPAPGTARPKAILPNPPKFDGTR